MPAPRALCIHDLSGVGRCSLGVILPVLAACGTQGCAVPTALLSTHTGGFGTPARADEAPFAHRALEHYQALELSFDCIYSGYLASPDCAQLACEAHRLWPEALKVADPVLGDNGRPYAFVTPQLAEAMAGLCRTADIITPNVTESALLLGRSPEARPWTQEEALGCLAELQQVFGGAVVLTGISLSDGTRANGILPAEGGPVLLRYTQAAGHCPGTGDLFCAALTGTLLRGLSLSECTALAAEFVRRAVESSAAAGTDARFGAEYEAHLSLLIPKKESESVSCSH